MSSYSNHVAVRLARLAHWMVADPKFTKAMVSAELVRIARSLDPSISDVILEKAKPCPHCGCPLELHPMEWRTKSFGLLHCNGPE